MRIAQIAILLVLFNFSPQLSFCIIHLPFCLFEMATTKKEFQAMCRGLTQPRNELGCLGPLYAIVIFIGVGERARWRAWAFPPCTPRIPFHGDGACTLVLHRGVELRPLCAWVHTPLRIPCSGFCAISLSPSVLARPYACGFGPSPLCALFLHWSKASRCPLI